MLTWLYVPGDRPDRFASALSSGADTVIVDLEDAVAPDRKAAALEAVAELLSSDQPLPVQVRISSFDQLDVLTGLPGLTGVRVPKVESPQGVRAADVAGVPVHALIESARGVEAAFEIATACAPAGSIGLGEADLSADLHVTDESGLTWARSRVVVAARAAGLAPPAMSVYPHVTDLEGLAASCAAGRRLGMLGRAAIHPRQLPVIAEAFRPTSAEIEKAQMLLAAFDPEAGTAVLPDGRFVDIAMVTAAQRTVALAARLK
ncbi:MAG: CoA ester lyase [Hamadaea sp.]|nr:CoA ester lyase [Hamadaea sp.]